MKQHLMKKVVVSGLALAMVMGSATSAFANNGNGNGNGKGNNSWNSNKKFEAKGNMNIRLSFDDLKGSDVEWAMRYIASLASKRVFEGYDDGTFKPRNAISRIEAITAAVRLMGLRDEAESSEEMETKLNFKDANQIPSWAVGYVAVALENDLFSESDDSVQPQKEADRLWATTLLVKALKLDSEAKAKMNTELPFKDAKQIPAGSVGYVAVAIEKGLIDGFEDNTFRPNQPVTRAQLAALLDRTGEQMPNDDADLTTGTITAISSDDDEITITKSGSSSTYELHSDAFIYRNGEKVDASELEIGDVVKVRTYDDVVVFVEVTDSADDEEQITEGTITAVTDDTITIKKSGVTSKYTLHPDVFIYRNGEEVDEDELEIGDEIKLRTQDDEVIFIEVTSSVDDDQVTKEGTITAAVSDNKLTIANSGTTSQYTLDSDAFIYRDGEEVDASDLRIGDEVEIRIESNKVVFVEVTDSADANDSIEVSGTLNGTTLNSNGTIKTISIKQTINGNTQTVIYNVASDVKLTGDLSEFVVGHRVDLEIENQIVTSIDID